MVYAVISDTHDNHPNLHQALKIIQERGITNCFHLGDYCSPGIVRVMLEPPKIHWTCIWGNNDGDKAKIILDHKNNSRLDIVEGSFREINLTDGKIFLVHFPLLGQHAAKSGDYKAVFYGHNHTQKIEVLDNGTLLANPGELGGLFKPPSFGIWDSTANTMEIIDLTDFRVAK